MDYNALAGLLFPDIDKTPDYYEEMYPPRPLKDSARVTRFAPSPTGFVHLGGLFGALADIFTARSTGGVSYLRIEDTDKKREIGDGVSAIIEGLSAFGAEFDEGVTMDGEKGDYGPYTQSKRVEIYKTVAKSLVEKGLAYPCFMTAEDLDEIRACQEAEGADIRGCFGKWAKCRDLSLDEIQNNIAAGKSWVLRFRADPENEGKRIAIDDIVRGKIEMPANIIDEVLLKSDGVPTYHFAHVCDDHFMRTTHVIRGEEWISSVPKHIALFKACGYKVPKYAHTPQVMKIDEEDGTKRKLSKRKDPEAAVSYFTETGYPPEAVVEYLLTLLNSNFEDWRKVNAQADIYSFPFNLKKMSVSGCLFDMAKLRDISKNVIGFMSADEVYSRTAAWAEKYDPELYALLTRDEAYGKAIFAIDRGGKKPRKDIACWSEVKDYLSYFYDELYTADPSVMPENVSAEDRTAILARYAEIYDDGDDKDTWFGKIKSLCEPLGFTPDVKAYRQEPDKYKGHVGDVSTVIRVAVTSRTNTPDLYFIMKILGKEKVLARLAMR